MYQIFKKLLFYIFLFPFASCAQFEKSEDIIKHCYDILLYSKLDEQVKIDSALTFANKALEVDNQNINLLEFKAEILFKKRDINGLIGVAEKLIELKPEKPYYLAKKASFLELKGDSTEAKRYFEKAILMYQEYLNNDSLNFDLSLEYITVLVASNDIPNANSALNEMKTVFLERYQQDLLEDFVRVLIDDEQQALKYWRGEESNHK